VVCARAMEAAKNASQAKALERASRYAAQTAEKVQPGQKV